MPRVGAELDGRVIGDGEAQVAVRAVLEMSTRTGSGSQQRSNMDSIFTLVINLNSAQSAVKTPIEDVGIGGLEHTVLVPEADILRKLYVVPASLNRR